MNVSQIANLIAATAHANALGLPFNRMITIHWERAGIALPQMPRATGRFTDLMAKAIARSGGATAWLYTHENGEAKGGHCHLLAHVPADRAKAMPAMQKRWLRSITGRPYRARVILSRPIGGRLGLEKTNPDLHAANLAEALGYLIKGANGAAAQQFGLIRLEEGGLVIGKRCGTSQNIATKARLGAAAMK